MVPAMMFLTSMMSLMVVVLFLMAFSFNGWSKNAEKPCGKSCKAEMDLTVRGYAVNQALAGLIPRRSAAIGAGL